MMRMALAVAAGGVVGTLIRFGVGNWVNANWPRYFYGATLAVNLLGCLLIGYLYMTFLERPDIPLEIRAGLVVGVLGALTTFSTFSLDTLRLLESGQIGVALGYLVLSVGGGLLAAWLGVSLARL
ncbi:fluoride efflux transporter CrcB [Stutzerimonas nosocomialis]|uniref:Fluoride-specific ion channel FluC n=1 Tax=Stutzerimonas nosocomialis TaxID=1056496 RepID=A0A5R9QC27_9GAMM|nr:fluoride efflux transporter CrcB [Stutzerimonas nosocomialis]TLX62689.1 fluoride efflux transporter CrcB [Stutzerimonas nosocomialis]